MNAKQLDVAEMRRHLAWLGHFGHGCVQLDLSKGDEHHQSFHAGAESLIAEVRLVKYAGWKPQISINPRPAEMAGTRFKSCTDEDVTLITNVRFDLDPVRALSAATAESVRAEFEKARQQAAERGRQIAAVPPSLFARLPGAAKVTADGTVAEHSLVAAGVAQLARDLAGATLSKSAMDALVTSTFKAARGQPATDAERAFAFEGANTAADLLGELGFGVNLAVDSGNGVHIWLEIAPVEVPDAAARGIVKAGLRALENRIRERVCGQHPRLRVDPVGGLSSVTRLVGVLNTKGANTAERPHRAVAICVENPRGDGVALRDWLLTEGRRAVDQRAAELAARKAEVAARAKEHPGLTGEPRNFEKRVERLIDGQLDKKPISGAGHTETLGALLALAGVLVRLGLDDYQQRFADLVHEADVRHWPGHGLVTEIEKALDLASRSNVFGSFKAEMLQEDAAQDAANREMRARKVATTKSEQAPRDDGFGQVEGYDQFEGNAALDTSEQRGDDAPESSRCSTSPREEQSPAPAASGPEQRRSPEQIAATKRCIERMRPEPDVFPLLALTLREWSWTRTDVSTALGEGAARQAWAGPCAVLKRLDDEHVTGEQEDALRAAVGHEARPLITQLRYLAGQGFERPPTTRALESMAPDGEPLTPEDVKNGKLSWLGALGGSPDADGASGAEAQRAFSTRYLATVLGKDLGKWSDPEATGKVLWLHLQKGKREPNEFITALEEAQPAPWKRWIWPIPQKGIQESKLKIGLCGLEANDLVRYDRFAAETMWVQDCAQWEAKRGAPFIDKDDITWQRRLEKALPSNTISRTTLRTAMTAFAREFSFDSAQDWLDSVAQWDGVTRFGELLRLMHAPQDSLHERMMFWWTGQLVRRIQEPGAQADYVLLLVGDQGRRKSSLFEIFGLRSWALNLPLAELTGNPDKLARKLQARLVVNVDEWGGVARKDREAIKSFITGRRDDFDVKWQKSVEKAKRRFVLGATTNARDVLNDPTGDRRYLPVELQADVTDAELEVVEQLWPLLVAEARERMAAGENYWPSKSEEAEVRELQGEGGFRATTDIEDVVHANLDRMLSVGVQAFLPWEACSGELTPEEPGPRVVERGWNGSLRPDEGGADDGGLERWRNYQSFLSDKAKGHSVREAIRSWEGPGGATVGGAQAKVFRADGTRRWHYMLSANGKPWKGGSRGGGTVTLDNAGDVVREVAQ